MTMSGLPIDPPRVALLWRYLASLNAEERAALLLRLSGWFRSEPEAEFWTAVEQLTLVERAAADAGWEGGAV